MTPPAPNDAERFAELAALAAVAGCQVHRGHCADGTCFFIAARWGLSRVLHDLDELARWVDRASRLAGSLREPVMHDPASRE